MSFTDSDIEEIRIDKWDALIFHDKEEDCHTICWTGKGGAIISHHNRDIAIKNWTEAMYLADSINTSKYLTHYNKFGSIFEK